MVKHELGCLRKAECKSGLIRNVFPTSAEELIQSSVGSPFSGVTERYICSCWQQGNTARCHDKLKHSSAACLLEV